MNPTQESINKFVKEEGSFECSNCFGDHDLALILHRAIKKGLELALAAGPRLLPTMFPAVFDMTQDKWMKAGAETALTAKNSAIEDLIKTLE